MITYNGDDVTHLLKKIYPRNGFIKTNELSKELISNFSIDAISTNLHHKDTIHDLIVSKVEILDRDFILLKYPKGTYTIRVREVPDNMAGLLGDWYFGELHIKDSL